MRKQIALILAVAVMLCMPVRAARRPASDSAIL